MCDDNPSAMQARKVRDGNKTIQPVGDLKVSPNMKSTHHAKEAKNPGHTKEVQAHHMQLAQG
jgi:hypothetical protein